MRLLAVDIGGYTQDILLYDTSKAIENCFKMVMPTSSVIVARRMEQATREGRPLLLRGVNMGGGFSTGAMKRHLKAGLKVYATPEAACTFDDDLEEVASWGVKLVSEDEAAGLLSGSISVELKDLDVAAIENSFRIFGEELDLDAIAVAVLDHGAAPRGTSDRVFRFQHLRRTVEKRAELEALLYLANEVPSYLTRMLTVAKSLSRDLPLLLTDTGVAAAFGALEDREVAGHSHLLVSNLGNMHTLAFHLEGRNILGIFEHHSRKLDSQKLDSFLLRLVDGTLSGEEVFNDGGHGCFILKKSPSQPFFTITGPRRSLMRGSSLRPHFATPHGDMMLSGCFGLVRAFALRSERWRQEIENSLDAST